MLRLLSSANWNPTDPRVAVQTDRVLSPTQNAAIVTAAGLSSRMGPGDKKELCIIDGVPVIRMCLEAFVECRFFDHIVITHSQTGRSGMEAALEGLGPKVIWVPGGATRQQSIFGALKELSGFGPDIVLIHDGARPWVTPALIRSVLRGAQEHGACVPVVPLTDAPKRIAPDGSIVEHIDKTALANAQTPQGFRYTDIFEAHRVARESGNDYSDDAEAYYSAIGTVYTVTGDPANRKITYGYDLK